MSENKLNLKDVNKKEIKRFNTLEAVGQIIDEKKMPIFTHPAKNVDIVAAKDTGKSFPVDVWKIYLLERDPNATVVSLMKYSTGAAKRGSRSLANAIAAIKRDFDLPTSYRASSDFYYKEKSKRDMLMNQYVEYGSFENSDRFANYSVPFGGYTCLIHIEEPVLKGDRGKTPTKEEWDSEVKTLEDGIFRTWRSYNETNPYHPPLAKKVITTMNDWEPNHPVSKRAEFFYPQSKFLNWVLGFEYTKLLELWKDKIDGESVVPQLKQRVDELWDDIKEGVLERHTGYVYVDTHNGIKEDRLIVRMQKFANPSLRKNEAEKEETYNLMYKALITGDTYELARTFGMGYGGTNDEDKLFNFHSFQPIDTDKKLREEKRQLLGFSIGWDFDANRGPVGTPVTISGIPVNVGTPFQPVLDIQDMKVLIHPQFDIQGYGKGVEGVNAKRYIDILTEASKEKLVEYCKKYNTRLKFGKHFVVDNDNGTFVFGVAQELKQYGYDTADALENKNGKIEDGGFGTEARDDVWQTAVDLGIIEVDEKNVMLVDWLKQGAKMGTGINPNKRMVTGKWSGRVKDVHDSAEYGWWPFRYQILYEISKYRGK